MKIQIQTAALAAVAFAMLAMLAPTQAAASAQESFVALRSVEAEPLSPAEMQSITGGDTLSIAAALSAAAAAASNPTTAASLSALASAYSRITVPTSRLFINRVLVRR